MTFLLIGEGRVHLRGARRTPHGAHGPRDPEDGRVIYASPEDDRAVRNSRQPPPIPTQEAALEALAADARRLAEPRPRLVRKPQVDETGEEPAGLDEPTENVLPLYRDPRRKHGQGNVRLADFNGSRGPVNFEVGR